MVQNWFNNKFPAFTKSIICEQERKEVSWFISMETARKFLREFDNCETLDEIRDVIETHFDRIENAHSDNVIEVREKAS